LLAVQLLLSRFDGVWGAGLESDITMARKQY
jgi:hypothetical protein